MGHENGLKIDDSSNASVWASFCLNHAPIACLVAAVLTFSVGLVAWTFASSLGIVVTACAITHTAATAIILIAVVFWETKERLREYEREFREYGVNPLLAVWRRLKYPYALVRSTLSGSSPGLAAWLRQKWHFLFGSPIHRDSAVHAQSEDKPGGESRIMTPVPEDGIDDTKSGPMVHFPPELPQHSPTKWQSRNLHLKRPSPLFLGIPTAPSDQIPDTPFSPISPAVEEHASTPILQRTFRRRAWDLAHDKNLRAVIRSTPMGTTGYRRNELNNIRPVRALLSERPIGRDMHFSPDGSYLAVSRVDGMVAIWKVDDLGEHPITIPAPAERFAWSTDGSYIVNILHKGFQIWDRNKVRSTNAVLRESIVAHV